MLPTPLACFQDVSGELDGWTQCVTGNGSSVSPGLLRRGRTVKEILYFCFVGVFLMFDFY